jgi:predicted signal transduction protein with EAL and GGDEF domain
LRNADLALYLAKAEGRGTYRFFEPEMDARAQARRIMEMDLRAALSRGEFELHYQPIYDLAKDEIVCFEALLRWHHPRDGMILPAKFIPLAEETGLIVPIGAWVLLKACLEAAGWSRRVRVAVNVSPAQFKSPSLLTTVMAALSESHLAANRLELEITETVLLQDSQGTLIILHQLRDLGVRISMDDFGTGYSSLSYLRSFPFESRSTVR